MHDTRNWEHMLGDLDWSVDDAIDLKGSADDIRWLMKKIAGDCKRRRCSSWNDEI